jgi:hypothetical protein
VVHQHGDSRWSDRELRLPGEVEAGSPDVHTVFKMKIKLILLLLAATTMGALSESNNMFVILTAPQFKANWLSGFKKDRSGKIIPSLETILVTLKRIKTDGVSSSKNLIDETSIRTIMDKGYGYHV